MLYDPTTGSHAYYVKKEISKINDRGEILAPHHTEEMILYTSVWQGDIAKRIKEAIERPKREGQQEVVSPTFLDGIDLERDFTSQVINEQKTNNFSPFKRCWNYVHKTEDTIYTLSVKKLHQTILFQH